MGRYLLIESRDPLECRDSEDFLARLAMELVNAGHGVTVFLVQNGTTVARKKAAFAPVELLGRAGVTVLADDYSLRERGIGTAELAKAVRPAPIDVVIERLLAGDRAIWH